MTGKPTYEELEQRVKELEKEVVELGRLEKQSQVLSLAVEQSGEGIAVVDLDDNIEYLNDAFADIHEYSAEELIGKNLSVFHTPQQMPSVEAANRQIKGTGSFQGEIWHVTRGGTIFPTQMHNSLIFNDAGEPIGMIGTVRDISDAKQTEEALRESEERYYAMFEHMKSGVAVYEPVDNGKDFIFRAFNSAAERITRISRNAALGNRLLDLFPNMDKSGLLGGLYRVWKTGKDEHLPPFYYKDETREGWRENRIYKLPSGDIVVLFDDVTKRKQVEDALQKAHDELELRVAERTEELRIRTHDLDERVKELNCFYGISQLLEKSHISLEKTLQGVIDLIPFSWQYPENTCVRLAFNGQELKTKKFKESSWKQSADIKVHNDRVGTVEVFYIKEKQEMHEGPFTKQERNLINAIAERLGNILVRFQSEEALIIRDKAIASSINGMVISDNQGNLTYINESSLKMWGYDETEVLGKPVVDFWLRKKEAVKAMKILIDKGTWTGELIAKRKDGTLFDAQVFAKLITDDKGKNTCVVSSFIDVTKEKMLEDELIRSERLAASGGLATSIAHEINSPL